MVSRKQLIIIVMTLGERKGPPGLARSDKTQAQDLGVETAGILL